MKAIIYRYMALVILLLAAGCVSTPDDSAGEQGEFSASVAVTRSSTEDNDESTLLDSGVLKLYNSSGGLVRYYTAVTETIIDYVAVGSYYATYRAGVANSASFDTDLSYYGETNLTSIVSQHTSRFEIEATVQNTILSISLDEVSLSSHFTEYSVVAYAANSLDEVNDSTPTLTYTTDNDGYFILPDGVESIVWVFVGDQQDVLNGTISSAQKGYKYSLSFKYSDRLNISGISLNFADIVYNDDIFDFKVQPVIKTVEFEEGAVMDFLTQQSFEFAVTSISPLSTISVSVGSDLYNATFTTDEATASDKVTYNTTTSTLTLGETLFASLTAGDYLDVVVVATAENGASDSATLQVGISGSAGVDNEDFWGATADFKWYTTYTAQSVQMRYRYKGDSDWIETYEASSSDGGHSWSASNEVVWSDAFKNDSLSTVYQYLDGYRPSAEYEYQMIIDGAESDITPITASAASLSIPYSDFSDSGLSCYTTSNGNAEFWASGNNSYTSSLCTYDSSNVCAYMATSSYLGTVAAGNMFTGTFAMGSGFSGTASFGQTFDWAVRPASMSFRYKVTVGSSTDKAKVMVAIVDWSSRHGVTSGTSSPVGVWNPEVQSSVDEGAIIGYGIVYFESSTSTFAEIEIPIYYYDKITQPSKKYQIVILATASYLGDYTEGSTSSKLWVDDFKFNY